MALVDYPLGSLYVVQDAKDHFWINRLLKRIDGNLTLEQHVSVEHEHVWVVVEDTGRETGERYVVVYEWRDGLGRPIPVPTEQIVTEFERRRQERQAGRTAPELGRAAHERNLERQQRRKAEQREGHEELTREFERLAKRSPTVPRSRGLQLARQRNRAKGRRDGE